MYIDIHIHTCTYIHTYIYTYIYIYIKHQFSQTFQEILFILLIMVPYRYTDRKIDR